MTYMFHGLRLGATSLGVSGVLLTVGASAQTAPAGPAPAPPGVAAPRPAVTQPSSVPPRAAQAPPATRAAAPRPVRQPRPGEVETDPIQCWWKTDRTSIRVGERFSLVLTCGAIETGPDSSRIAVTIQSNQLEGGAVQLTPFEVVSAVRRNDVIAPPWRYLQFEYSVRLLSEGFFGKDVSVPALTVTYNVKAPGGGGTQGRDQSYVLPALPMRVLSLAPAAASDIRDAWHLTFAAGESRRFQSSAAMVGSLAAYAFAALFAVLALARLARLVRKPKAAVAPPLATPAVLSGCLTALRAVKSEVQSGGWTPEAARQGLAALRVAGAEVLGRPVSQLVATRDAPVHEGQLAIPTGWLRRGRALVSAAVTPASLSASSSGGASLHGRARATADQLSASLTAVAYGRGSAPDATELDAALERGVDAVRKLRFQAWWPMRTAAAVARSIGVY
jgi:hypothetical protein